jgi:FtsP/CotA-like multicopper oxidase with cupredoxin domain
MTIQVRSDATASSRVLPAVVNQGAEFLARDDEHTRMLPHKQFVLSMGQGRGYINGKSFDVVDGDIVSEMHMSVADADDEVWEIVNQSGMDHPWHQHVNDGQIISVSGSGTAIDAYARLMTLAPAWKDTIIVPKWGSVKFRLPIRDFTGMTMFHCHILEHEDIGMMGMWHIMDGGMPPMPMGT